MVASNSKHFNATTVAESFLHCAPGVGAGGLDTFAVLGLCTTARAWLCACRRYAQRAKVQHCGWKILAAPSTYAHAPVPQAGRAFDKAALSLVRVKRCITRAISRCITVSITSAVVISNVESRAHLSTCLRCPASTRKYMCHMLS